MRKILATIIKEWILLRRDIAGLALLLLMPSILIIVMSTIQDAPFRDYQELRFDLLLADNDNNALLSQEIKTGLKQSKNFHVIDSLEGKPLTEEKLKELLRKGDYRVGIMIPRGATAEIANSANLVANKISEKLGLGTLPTRETRDSLYIRTYFDPVTKPTFRMSIGFALDKFVTASSSSVLMQRLGKLTKMSGDTAATVDPDMQKVFKGISIKEDQLDHKAYNNVMINSVQHNVPAWAIFGMFFIVVPIAGHIIREREERSALRIALIPNAIQFVGLGKIFFYVIICTVQFLLMLSIGIYVLPLFGLSRLELGVHPFVIIPMAVCIAFAATSYGYFVGTIFKTTNQALPFGAISVVILSALGGIWIPVDILPPIAQKMALVSPLHWALDGVNQLFLRNLGFADVASNMLMLIAFSLVLWLITVFKNSRRGSSI